eukprot:4661044-Heterocapsa_arctica.AAC.1
MGRSKEKIEDCPGADEALYGVQVLDETCCERRPKDLMGDYEQLAWQVPKAQEESVQVRDPRKWGD